MTNYTDQFVNSAIAALQALQATYNNPADQIRLLADFCSYNQTTNLPADLSTIQAATAAMLRRVALSVLATSCANYNPTSVQDAASVIATVRPLYDAEILYAADNYEDDVVNDLTTLEQSVITDLKARSTNLPNLNYYNLPTSLPTLALANQLYGDVTRADEILQLNNKVPHPLFFSANFFALNK